MKAEKNGRTLGCPRSKKRHRARYSHRFEIAIAHDVVEDSEGLLIALRLIPLGDNSYGDVANRYRNSGRQGSRPYVGANLVLSRSCS